MSHQEFLKHYRLIEQIGCGGTSVVYRAYDSRTSQIVAIKVLHPYLAEKVEYKNRLIREAYTTSKLEHPNIPKIVDLVAEGSELFIVAEFVEGVTLKQFATTNQLWETPEAGALIIAKLADALHYAHSHGIIHRDIKPDNIMVTKDGQLKLMDFGIAHLSSEESLTVTGGMVGSPAHMAPELIDGRPCDARTDVFSLATLFYWLATGVPAFDGGNPHAVLKNVLEGNFKPLEDLSSRLLPGLRFAIEKGMATRPEDRFESAADFAHAINTALAFMTHSPRLVSILSGPQRELKRLGRDVRSDALVEAQLALAKEDFVKGTVFLNRILADEPFHQQALDLLENNAQKRPSKRSRLVVVTAAILGLACALEITVLSIDTAKSDAPLIIAETAPTPRPRLPEPVKEIETPEVPLALPKSVRKTTISVTPFADIWIDGKQVAQNKTSIEAELDPGEHQVTFRHEFAATQERIVKVTRGGRAQHLHVDLERVKPATLMITSNVDADVAVDGVYKGTSFQSQRHPILISFPKKAFSRRLEVIVSQKGYHPYVASHILAPGKKQNIDVKLQPEPS